MFVMVGHLVIVGDGVRGVAEGHWVLVGEGVIVGGYVGLGV